MAMTCPICKRRFEPAAAAARAPFCGERCKLIDLGRWLSGTYQLPVDAIDDESDSPAPDDEAS